MTKSSETAEQGFFLKLFLPKYAFVSMLVGMAWWVFIILQF
jgi:hypothetical protein